MVSDSTYDQASRLGHTNLYLAVVDFFNHLNMLYGTVTEFCNPQEVRPS